TPHDSNFTIAIILLILSLVVVQNFIDSRDGRAVMSIRDNRIAAESIGIPVTKYKMLAFVISAAIAGMAGVIFSHNIATLQSTSQYFGYNVSIMILVYVVLGGIGNIRGSVIAAAVLYLLPELLRGLNKYRMLIYSIVLIAVMIINWAPKAIEKRTEFFDSLRRRLKNGAA
ncbi:MAG: branched-chain amino acid ABC transporter permease, partial [Lachnospiraceae bacterium]|nr:branched-chain amino acid ABC transporter permease [Lachnospiraceae bacterium]